MNEALNKNKVPILMSFSGGRSSALALRLLTYNGVPGNMIILFANTGKEKPQTLDFVKEVGERWQLPIVWVEANLIPFVEGMTHREQIEFKVVSFETCSRFGEPFTEIVKRFGVPNRQTRFCTEYLKRIVMFKYMLSLGVEDWDTVMGIRYDEPERVIKNKAFIMPLNDAKITKRIVREWWAKQEFDLQLKDYEGNCDFCHLKSIRKRKTIAYEHPELTTYWSDLEKMAGSTFQQGKSVEQIVIESRKPFARSLDEYEKQLMQPDLFGEDLEISCFCGD